MAQPASGLFSIPVTTIDGKSGDLSAYRGKVLLIVNTASQCGFTPQYEGLARLAKKYRARGFEVLGFPSNDFGGQEPGSNAEIRLFCQKNYAVDFPLFAKAPVSGKEIQPIFAWVLLHSPEAGPVEWNFEKFLVGRDGEVLRRYKSSVTPEHSSLTDEIERLLSKGQPAQ